MLGLLAAATGRAEAEMVSFTYSGTITGLDDFRNDFGGKIHLGDSFTGSVTYDTALADNNSNPNIGGYLYSNHSNPPMAAPLGITLIVGSGANQVTIQPNYANVFTVDVFNNQISTLGPADGFQAIQPSSLNGASTIGGLLALSLADQTQTALSSDVLPPSLRLADFTDGILQIIGTDPNTGADVTILEGTPGGLRSVPEPGSLALIGLGGLGLIGYARRRPTRRGA